MATGRGYPWRNEDEKKKETVALESSGNVEIPMTDREVIGKDDWVFAPHRQHRASSSCASSSVRKNLAGCFELPSARDVSPIGASIKPKRVA